MNNTGTKQVSIMKETAFWREKNGEYRACLKYSVPIFVEKIYKMQRLDVSGAVRPIYGSLGVKRLIYTRPFSHAHSTFLHFFNSVVKLQNFFFFTMAQQPPVGQSLLIIEDSWSHSVGLLWTSDQPEEETSTWRHTTLTRDRRPCHRRDSNPQSQQASGCKPTP